MYKPFARERKINELKKSINIREKRLNLEVRGLWKGYMYLAELKVLTGKYQSSSALPLRLPASGELGNVYKLGHELTY